MPDVRPPRAQALAASSRPTRRDARARRLALAAALLLAPVARLAAQDDADAWRAAADATIARLLAERPIETRAKNVILFLGDGMGVSTITAARIREGQLRGETGEENSLAFETLPYSALIKTYDTNQQVPDSAGTMSAIMTGSKTRAGVISVDPELPLGAPVPAGTHALATLLEDCERRGMRTGVVTTARLTHATPACCYAHVSHRDWECDADMPDAARTAGVVDIARQLAQFPVGDGIDVALGGGRAQFVPRAAGGRRTDGLDLERAWADARPGRVLVHDASELAGVPSGSQVLGLFAESHMPYVCEEVPGVPSLADMTSKALDLLGNEHGYFLMVEGGRIDHGHHAGNAYRALSEAIAFSDAVRVALERTDPTDTLVLVTADHSHVFTMAGYPARGNDILGWVSLVGAHGKPALDLAGRPYTTLGYATGPGGALTDRRPDDVDPTARDYQQDATHALESETHGGEDVAAFARGPWAHLVRGVLEQNVLHHVMALALDPPLRGDAGTAPFPARKSGDDDDGTARADAPTKLRVATFNASLFRGAPGELARDLGDLGGDAAGARQAAQIVEILRRVHPDVLLVNEFDYDPAAPAEAAARLQKALAAPAAEGDASRPLVLPERFVAPVNTGVPSGVDLDGDGVVGTEGPAAARDALGYGVFPGQYGMLVLSRFPIDRARARTFQHVLWKDMPGAHLPRDPDDPTRGFYSDAALAVLPLPSKSLWDVPVRVDGHELHVVVSHPTPPVFDGPEDRNGLRNADEIRLLADVLAGGEAGAWLVDDRGGRGGLPSDASFVALGDLNCDPLDGDGVPGAVARLLAVPRVNATVTPASRGAARAAKAFGGKNATQRGRPEHDTTDFDDATVGNLRLDYVLPSSDLRVLDSGVYWPAEGEPGAELVDASDHRLVWMDLAFP
ncbi:MAG: alkaline phosphatase [Planctomycetes bacterium]|nr:alkaline phosphatase [Planctomycetota bacterium]